MIRILVDENVRKIADDYASNVFRNRKRSFKQPLDLLRDFRKNALEQQDDTNGKALCAYVGRIIKKHSELLHAEPNAMKDFINEFNRILNMKQEDEIKVRMDKEIDYENKKQKFHDWIVELMRYDYVCHGIIPYLQKINIRTYVYCNAQYAATAKKQDGAYEAFYELDHFYPKSLYPFLCTNFYNFQPCCGACNKHKSNKKSSFNLYTNDVEEATNPFLFSVDRESVVNAYLASKNTDNIQICFDDLSDTALKDNHEDCFHITALYAAFKDVDEEIIWKRKARDKSYMQMLKKQYEGLLIPEPVQRRIIFGFYMEEANIHLRPLTNLQQDLYKQQDLV